MSFERFLSSLSRHTKQFSSSQFLPSAAVTQFPLAISRTFKPHGATFIRSLSSLSTPPMPSKPDAKSKQSDNSDKSFSSVPYVTLSPDRFNKTKRYPRWAGYLLVTSLILAIGMGGYRWIYKKRSKTSLQAVLDLWDKEDGLAKALSLLSEQIQQNPMLQAAFELLQQGKIIEAELAFDRYFLNQPDEYVYWVIKGIFFQKIKHSPKRALACLDHAVKLSPEKPEAYYYKGIILWHILGRFKDAIAVFDEALKYNPGYISAYICKGNILADQGNLDDAIATYNEILIKYDPNNKKAHFNIGVTFASKGELDCAITSYNEALKLDSSNAEAHCNKGHALLSKGNLDDAIASFDRALECNPDDICARGNQGVALEAKGEWARAIKNYKEVIKRSPYDFRGHYKLAACLTTLGRYDQALSYYQQIINSKSNLILSSMAQEAMDLICLKRSKTSSLFVPTGDRERHMLLKELGFDQFLSHADSAKLSKAVYSAKADKLDKNLPSGWRQLACSLDSGYKGVFTKGGYLGAAYLHEATGHIVIAHCGTRLNNPGAVEDDKSITFAEMPVQFQPAWEFSEAIHQKYPGAPITYTGHSLGAALAELCAFESQSRGTYFPAVTFDSPGTKQIIQSKLAKRGDEFDPYQVDVITYFSTPNFINTLSPHIGLQLRIHAIPTPATPGWSEWFGETVWGLSSQAIFSRFPSWVIQGGQMAVVMWPHIKGILPDSITGTVAVAGMGIDVTKETAKLCRHTLARHSIDHISAVLDTQGEELTGFSRVTKWPDGPLKYVRLECFCRDAKDFQKERFAGVHPDKEVLSPAERIKLEDDIGYQISDFYTKELPLYEFNPAVRKFLEDYYTAKDKSNLYGLSPIILVNYKIETRGKEKIVVVTHDHLYAPDFRTYVTHHIHAFERQRRMHLEEKSKPHSPVTDGGSSPAASRDSFFAKDVKLKGRSSAEPGAQMVKPEMKAIKPKPEELEPESLGLH